MPIRKIRFRNELLDRDPFVGEFTRRTLEFALFDAPVRQVQVDLRWVGESDGRRYVCCGMRAEFEDREALEVGATGSDLYEGIARGADLLEATLSARAVGEGLRGLAA